MNECVTIRLSINCIDLVSCEVFFEPEGASAVLTAGDYFIVELSGPPPALPEVSFLPEGIMVTAWTGADTRAWNRAGDELRL